MGDGQRRIRATVQMASMRKSVGLHKWQYTVQVVHPRNVYCAGFVRPPLQVSLMVGGWSGVAWGGVGLAARYG